MKYHVFRRHRESANSRIFAIIAERRQFYLNFFTRIISIWTSKLLRSFIVKISWSFTLKILRSFISKFRDLEFTNSGDLKFSTFQDFWILKAPPIPYNSKTTKNLCVSVSINKIPIKRKMKYHDVRCHRECANSRILRSWRLGTRTRRVRKMADSSNAWNISRSSELCVTGSRISQACASCWRTAGRTKILITGNSFGVSHVIKYASRGQRRTAIPPGTSVQRRKLLI